VQSLLGDDTQQGQSQRGLSMTLLGVGGLAGGLASGFLANRFGQRPVQAACFILCLLLAYGLFQLHSTYTATVPVGIALLGICFGVSQGVLHDYIPGLFPAAVRSAATGLCFHTGRAFTAAAVFFVGALVVWFGGYGNAIFAFSLVYIVGFAALFL
jgi:MFS family permease